MKHIFLPSMFMKTQNKDQTKMILLLALQLATLFHRSQTLRFAALATKSCHLATIP